MTATTLKYYSFSQRMIRIGLTIVFLYALLNGSKINVAYGVYWAMTNLGAAGSGFGMVVGGLLVFALVALLLAFIIRRIKLVAAQTDGFLLTVKTLAILALVVVGVLLAGRATTDGFFTLSQYVNIFYWTWQIPIGFAIASGLNWSIEDRAISGVYSTDERPVDHDA